MFKSIVKLAPVFVLSGLVALVACGGSSTGGSSSSGGGDCGSLTTCCGKLPTADQAGCKAVANADVAADCTAALDTYKSAGECGGSKTTSTSTGSSGGGGCSSLMSCCSSLPSTEAPSCNAIVTDANDAACSAALTEFQAAGMCN